MMMMIIKVEYDAGLKTYPQEIWAEGKPLDAVGGDILDLFMVI